MNNISSDLLAQQHTDAAIAARISATGRHNYVGDFVLGAVDGTITTFAIVSGVAGAELQGGVMIAFVLGLANVLADGFSMAVSNYLKSRADAQVVARFRALEEMHIDRVPDREREEIRQIFAGKGFDGEILEEIVRVITRDRRRWVDTMLTEEWGLQLESPHPVKAALATFTAFLIAGMFPLAPLLLAFTGPMSPTFLFTASAVATGITFIITGLLRGKVTDQPLVRSALETLFVGGAAAALAYLVGTLLKGLLT